jgi:hypothetical protein
MDWTKGEFFRTLQTAWIGKLETAYRSPARKRFREEAEEAKTFYARSCAALWSSKYAGKFFNGVIKPPRFPISVNKTFEAIAVMVPNLLWDVPYRTVQPKRRWVLDQDVEEMLMQDQSLGPMLQQSAQADQGDIARASVVAKMMTLWLNYTGREVPDGGLGEHAQIGVIDAFLTGRGCYFPRRYTYPSGTTTLTGVFREDPMDVLIDPDCRMVKDATWMALRHQDKYWVVEQRFQMPKDSLKHRASLESAAHYSEAGFLADETTSQYRGTGERNDLIVWYEIWSKAGVGCRFCDMPDELKGRLDEVVGEYAYLAIASNVPYPLNGPPDVLRAGATDDDVRQMFSWPIPTWTDGRWPCHDPQTEVLTKAGWKFFSDLNGTELLATVNLESDSIEYQRPTNLIRHRHIGDMIRFKGTNKLDAFVTSNHRMVVYPAHSDVPELKAAGSINRSDQLKVTATGWNGTVPALPYFLDDVDPVVFAEWLGFYIAEGCCAKRKTRKGGTCSWQVVISQNKPEGVRYFTELSSKLPFHTQPYRRNNRGSGSFVISSKDLWNYLRPLGGSHEKYVPQWVKDGTQELIAAFLCGYVAGDGHIDLNGSIKTSTVSKQLADDIQELWFKVGKSACISEDPARPYTFTENGKTRTGISGKQYRVQVRSRNRASLKNPEKKTLLYERIADYDGMVYCATVPNGTLITRRNGQPLISGNCEFQDFYLDPDSPYPIPPMSAGMGWLKFLNVMVPFLCNRVYNSTRNFVAILEGQIDTYKKYFDSGEDFCIIPVKQAVEKIEQAIKILEFPQTNMDAWKVVEMANEFFALATGLTPFVYGMKGSESNDRSAKETEERARAAGVRWQYMQKRIGECQSRCGALESFCARWFVQGSDLAPLGGQTASLLWDYFVATTPPEQIVREMVYEVAASSIRRPDRDRDRASWQQAMQVLGPAVQEYAMQSGDFEAWNAIVAKWCEYMDMQDYEDLLIQPKPNPEAEQAQQQAQELEMAKLQAEAQGKQMDVQGKIIDIQGRQQQAELDMTGKVLDVQAKQQIAELNTQAKIVDSLLKAQQERMKLEVEAAKAQMELEKTATGMELDARGQEIKLTGAAAQMGMKLREGAMTSDLKVKSAKDMAKIKAQQAKQKPKPSAGAKKR